MVTENSQFFPKDQCHYGILRNSIDSLTATAVIEESTVIGLVKKLEETRSVHDEHLIGGLRTATSKCRVNEVDKKAIQH